MPNKKIIDLSAISTQSATDLYETSANGTGSFKETRAQQQTYWSGIFVQTTGNVTAGHLSVYGANGQTLKDCGVPVDTSENIYPNNSAGAFRTTATSGGTTTLTVGDAYNQFFTGTSTHTVVLPVTSTLTTGFSFYIVNTSTQNVTVESSGGNTVQVMAPNSTVYVTCVLTSGTTAASWYADAQGVGTDLFPNGMVVVTNSTQTIENGTAYVADAAGTVTFILPSAVPGTFFAIIGVNGWVLSLSSGQVVTIGSVTASGSSVANWQSVNVSDTVIFECIGGNTWQSISLSGNPVTSQGVTALATSLMAKQYVASSSQAMKPNNAYVCNNGAGLITYTLPTTLNSLNSNTQVAVYGTPSSSGGWKINAGTGVNIIYGNNTSSTNGSIQSTTAGDWVVLGYIAGAGTWQVIDFGGAPKLDNGGSLIGLASTASAMVVTDSSGNPVMTPTMTDGQVIIGSTGATPTAATLTASTNISITNGAHSISIATGFAAPFYSTLSTTNTTTSTTGAMCGFGSTYAYTPSKTGKVKIIFSGALQNNSAFASTAQLRFGTGTAPTAGAAPTGTAVGNPITASATATNSADLIFPVTFAVYITGLTLSTAYWFDIDLLTVNAGGGANFITYTFLLEEI